MNTFNVKVGKHLSFFTFTYKVTNLVLHNQFFKENDCTLTSCKIVLIEFILMWRS